MPFITHNIVFSVLRPNQMENDHFENSSADFPRINEKTYLRCTATNHHFSSQLNQIRFSFSNNSQKWGGNGGAWSEISGVCRTHYRAPLWRWKSKMYKMGLYLEIILSFFF